MKLQLNRIWHWLVLLGSGLALILLSPVVVLLKLLEKLKGYREQHKPVLGFRPTVVGSVTLVVLVTLLFHFGFLPSLTSSPETIPVVISQGESLAQITSRLDELGLISSPLLFKWSTKILNLDRKIHAGKYEFQTGQSMFSILGRLSRGGATAIDVTIPPGLTIRQIAKVFQDKIGADSLRFVQLTRDQEFIHTLELSGRNLEGYLFPETYNFYWKTKEEEIISTMVAQSEKVLAEELHYSPSGILKDELQNLVTLASLIEREGSKLEEYPLISAVFHNRLKIDMPLQCDPTVLYVLSPLNRPLLPEDLEIDSPYNTYKHYGLPPGPICNPGKEALKAALEPADVKYLYFVHRGDGTHIFSNSLEEHNRAIWLMKKNKNS